VSLHVLSQDHEHIWVVLANGPHDCVIQLHAYQQMLVFKEQLTIQWSPELVRIRREEDVLILLFQPRFVELLLSCDIYKEDYGELSV
jgi:hypothetical protein